MSKPSLLIEIGTEELPPKALNRLSDAFAQGVCDGLTQAELSFKSSTAYASPRRLAVVIEALQLTQADRDMEKRGPAVQAAFDKDGKPTKAAEGFARSCGVTVDQLERLKTDKGEWLAYHVKQQGQPASELLPDIIRQSLQRLPIPKRMRWGSRDDEFVRPVHWVVIMLGEEVITANILGIESGNHTRGHRFHHPDEIELSSADEYVAKLDQPGFVIVDREQRANAIREQAEGLAETLGGRAIIDEELLREVSALVEWPVAIAGSFDEHFLEVPAEALISSMQDHQKYFPLTDTESNLLAKFITISNIESHDVNKVIEGNERVIRPRLSDAAFFWEQDRKNPLETRMDDLDKVVFQNKLGSIGDKSRRMIHLAREIATQLGANTQHAERAAQLSKCDLMTEMVYEFTDLQGIMGRYYALHDGEPEDVAVALDEQYMPRFAGDELPENIIGQTLSIADRLDTLLGIFAIGQKPTGEKDPFALRRAALGMLRIMIERGLMLDVRELLKLSASSFASDIKAEAAIEDTLDFILERLKVYYHNQDIPTDVYDSVAELKPTCPVDFDRRIMAVNSFRSMPQAESLAAANKRISNILKKVETPISNTVAVERLQEDAEKQLYENLQQFSQRVEPLFNQGDYREGLSVLAELKDSVDHFFDTVMVMADDEALKNNRLTLLNQLRNLFLQTADLSRLQS